MTINPDWNEGQLHLFYVNARQGWNNGVTERGALARLSTRSRNGSAALQPSLSVRSRPGSVHQATQQAAAARRPSSAHSSSQHQPLPATPAKPNRSHSSSTRGPQHRSYSHSRAGTAVRSSSSRSSVAPAARQANARGTPGPPCAHPTLAALNSALAFNSRLVP